MAIKSSTLIPLSLQSSERQDSTPMIKKHWRMAGLVNSVRGQSHPAMATGAVARQENLLLLRR